MELRSIRRSFAAAIGIGSLTAISATATATTITIDAGRDTIRFQNNPNNSAVGGDARGKRGGFMASRGRRIAVTKSQAPDLHARVKLFEVP
jgi:hypothetical protein